MLFNSSKTQKRSDSNKGLLTPRQILENGWLLSGRNVFEIQITAGLLLTTQAAYSSHFAHTLDLSVQFRKQKMPKTNSPEKQFVL